MTAMFTQVELLLLVFWTVAAILVCAAIRLLWRKGRKAGDPW